MSKQLILSLTLDIALVRSEGKHRMKSIDTLLRLDRNLR